jgi:hypothetical protein
LKAANLQTLKIDISRKGWGHTASSYAFSKSHGSCRPDLSYGSVDTDYLLGGARKHWKRFHFYAAGSGWEKNVKRVNFRLQAAWKSTSCGPAFKTLLS